jgi:hypothetical protein
MRVPAVLARKLPPLRLLWNTFKPHLRRKQLKIQLLRLAASSGEVARVVNAIIIVPQQPESLGIEKRASKSGGGVG